MRPHPALSPIRLAALLFSAALLMLPTPFAQQPAQPAPPLTFEAATIKPSPRADNTWRLGPTPDGYSGLNISLLHLVKEAYGIYDPKLIVGGPTWIDRDRFDLEAKFDPAEIPDAKKLSFRQHADMLQPLLADRFHLKVHREMRRFPVFNLVIAKGGPKLKPSTPEHLHSYGSLHSLTGVEGGTTGTIVFDLRQPAGRPVIDKTGLTGRYDYDLTYASNPGTDSSAPDIFTAVQEQLGLKLIPSTASLEVLVIDSAEKPSAN